MRSISLVLLNCAAAVPLKEHFVCSYISKLEQSKILGYTAPFYNDIQSYLNSLNKFAFLDLTSTGIFTTVVITLESYLLLV